VGRDGEDELDLAHVGGEADAATHSPKDRIAGRQAQAMPGAGAREGQEARRVFRLWEEWSGAAAEAPATTLLLLFFPRQLPSPGYSRSSGS
jgi:hypothetical protein